MWGEDLLALNMKGGIPVIEGARLLRKQADEIAKLKLYKEKIEKMENAYNAHFAKAMGIEK
jgi:hypothetical protein